MANFGTVDRQQIESLRRVLGGVVDTSLKTRAMQLEVNKQKAMMSAKQSALGAYADALRQAETPYDPKVLNTGSEAASRLLSLGDTQGAEALLFDVRTRAQQIPTVKAPNLPEGFAQITDPRVKAETYNKTYGTQLPPSAFEQKPSAGQQTRAGERKQENLQKVKDSFNQSDSSVKAYEKQYGKDQLVQWVDLLSKEQPNAYQAFLNPDIPDEQKTAMLLQSLEGADPVLKNKLSIVGGYLSSQSKREGFLRNLQDRGFTVGNNDQIIKYTRPKKSAKPTIKY